MKKVVVASFALATAMSVGLASPALATAYVVDGTTWLVRLTDNHALYQIGTGGDGDTPPHAAYAGDRLTLEFEDPVNPGSYLRFECASPDTATLEDDGDQLVDCNDPTPLLDGNLTWDGDIKIFSGDYRGLVGRLTYVTTNTGDSPLTLNLRYYVNTEECNGGVGNVATSSGDLVASEADSWLLCNNLNEALEGIVWGNNFASSVTDDALTPNPTGSDLYYIFNDGFVLDPGQTATFVFFLHSEGALDHGATLGDTDQAITSNMTAYFDVSTLASSRLWEGLTTADNWSLTVPSPEEPLADTGFGSSRLSVVVVAGLALGVLGVVMSIRRRARA